MIATTTTGCHRSAEMHGSARGQASFSAQPTAARTMRLITALAVICCVAEAVRLGSLGRERRELRNEVNNATVEASFLQVGAGAGRYDGYCEICVRMLQMHQRGQPDVCSGLSDTFFLTVRGFSPPLPLHLRNGGMDGALNRDLCGFPCMDSPSPLSSARCRGCIIRAAAQLARKASSLRVDPWQCVKNLESLLKEDRALFYWHRTGCVHQDGELEIVKPCPPHAICGWIPNLFAKREATSAGFEGLLPPLCPRDVHFAPRVPHTSPPGEEGAGEEEAASETAEEERARTGQPSE